MITNNGVTKSVDYITIKVELLDDFGLTDKMAVEQYLRNKTANMNERQMEIMVDNIAKTMIDNFFDGDTTYVKKRKKDVM
jgi:uncharacterized protein (UPF0305 family)